jgi:DNA repair protein RadC
MKQRFLEYGLDNFSEHEVLELLLYYAIPRGDVNPLAHQLLDHFGSLCAVLDADPTELKQVNGVGDKTAALLHLMPPLFRRYRLSGHTERIFDNTEKAGKYLADYYISHVNELITIMLLDNSCRLLAVKALAEGNPRSVRIDYRTMLSEILRYNATNVILAHNHPGGICIPSREDFIETRQVRDQLRKIGVHLADHIIVAGEEWTSVAGTGL